MFRSAMMVLFVVLLGLSHGLVGAHAAAFGDAPHQHAGVDCALSGVRQHADDVVLPDAIDVLAPVQTWVVFVAFAQRALCNPTVTPHPPGQAPPFHSL